MSIESLKFQGALQNGLPQIKPKEKDKTPFAGKFLSKSNEGPFFAGAEPATPQASFLISNSAKNQDFPLTPSQF